MCAKTLEYFGVQFDSGAIRSTMATLERQRKERADYVFPSNRLTYTDGGQLVLEAGKTFRVGSDVFTEWEDAEKAADQSGEKIQVEQTPAALPLTGHAAGQLASVLGIPQVFIKNLREKKYSDLLGHNFRELLGRDSRRFLIRTLPDKEGNRRVRAFLSDRYRCLDNYDLFFAAADVAAEEVEAGKPRASVWKCRMSDDGGQFEMFLFSPHIYGEVRLDRPFDPGDGWMSRWHGQSGDGHNAACRVGNSETGTARLTANLSCLRKICANFCTWTEGVATVHLGKANEDEGLVLSQETRKESDRVVWLKVKDLIRSAFDPVKFQAIIDRLNGITQQEIEPQRAVDQVVDAYQIAEDRKALILGHLLGSGDRSRFGLVQAITATCHDLDRRGETEPASQLEEIGAKLVDMPDKAFATLVRV